MTRVVCISDTHGQHRRVDVPDGDVLVHAGDLSGRGGEREVRAFAEWFGALPHPHKVVVAGNHDFLFEEDAERGRELLGPGVVYLQHEAAEVAGLTFFGSPWQPWFHDWAFNLRRGEALAEKWSEVPAGVDVLVTHSPPFGVMDVTWRGDRVGCEDLARELERIRPRLHVFGHIHEAYGVVERDGTIYVNASACDARNALRNTPIVIDL